MDIIVRGESHELDFVRRLCRDKVRRGVLAILPATCPDCDEVVKLKNERDETTKENGRLKLRVKELETQLEGVPEIAETVPETVIDTENVAETVPETIPAEFKSVEDNKIIDVADMTEVNLDDVKDVPEVDTKEGLAPTPKKTRAKKQNKQC